MKINQHIRYNNSHLKLVICNVNFVYLNLKFKILNNFKILFYKMDKFGELYLDFSQNDINIDDLNLNTLWVELDKGFIFF